MHKINISSKGAGTPVSENETNSVEPAISSYFINYQPLPKHFDINMYTFRLYVKNDSNSKKFAFTP